MKKKHPYRLSPLHNPQKADESLVPSGWRMLYADEFPLKRGDGRRCRLFVLPTYNLNLEPYFGDRETCTGRVPMVTYIVPVA